MPAPSRFSIRLRREDPPAPIEVDADYFHVVADIAIFRRFGEPVYAINVAEVKDITNTTRGQIMGPRS